MGHEHETNHTSEDVVHFDSSGVVRHRGRVIAHIHAELVGGRNRYSVGGEITEGPRWWRGRLEWPGDDEEPAGGIEVIIELDNGRSGVAVVEPNPAAPPHTALVHGVGPPPFDVP